MYGFVVQFPQKIVINQLAPTMKASLQFSTRDEFYRIPISRIVFFVADKNYTVLQLSNGKTLLFTFSLQKMHDYIISTMGEELASRVFSRVGRSHIINLSFVYHIDMIKQRLVLYAEHEALEYIVPVSKDALRTLRALLERPATKLEITNEKNNKSL